MSDHDPLDDRLREGFRAAADAMNPTEVSDPSALADQLLARPVPPAGPVGWRGAFGQGWRGIGALAAIAVAGGGFGAWMGGSDPAPTAAPAGVAVGSTTLWRCPADGAIGRLTDGDRVVLTGRSTDGAWFQLRHPSDLSARSWVSAEVVDADTTPDGLPTVECGASDTPPDGGDAVPAPPSDQTTTTLVATTTSATPTTTIANGPTPTTVRPGPGPVPGPGPTDPTPLTTTAPPPADTVGPALANVGANPATVWTLEQPGIPCPADKRIWTSTVSASVSDPSGVASVRVDWSVNGRSGTVTMSPTGSTWRGAVGSFAADTLPTSGAGMNQTVNLTVRATDNAGNTATASTSFQLRSSAECFG